MSSKKHLSILYVAYPLLAISEDSAGGAEQMLLTLEREMAVAGHRTAVAAADGSRVAGFLLETGKPAVDLDSYGRRERRHVQRILGFLRKHWKQFDLLHDESGSFWPFAAQCKLPVLATLHLPRPYYGENSLRNTAYNVYFNSVSPTQARSFQDIPNLLGVVQNGIAVEQFPLTTRKQNYLLWMGRICEEKAPHLAIAAAKQAGLPILLAGQVYPFRSHQSYFDREIQPHLADDPEAVQFVETPSFRQKLKLLSEARALLLTSTAEETSSLVAMEAMACGTPVIAFRRGAFSEIVSEAETGFLTDTVNEMSKAIGRSDEISSAACRARVERHFTAARMASEYEWLYREVLTRSSMSLAA